MDVHLRELRYFVAVAEHLHFSRAAEALFVSQPALSKQIRALEARLRTPLFVRDRRAVRLTAAGEALLPGARDVLEAWRAAESAVAGAAAESGGTLVIGMSTGPGRGLLPAVRARFTGSAPTARLELRQVGWGDATAGLAAEEPVDAAFVWLPVPGPERFSWIPVAVEPCVVALPADHRLAARATVAVTDLLDEPFLALPRGAGVLRDFWLATDVRDGRAPVVAAEVASAEETAEALVAGLGVCLLAAGNAALVERDGVVLRPVTGMPESRLVLAWRADDDSPLLHLLRDAVLAATGGDDAVGPGSRHGRRDVGRR